jgi:hypothetical protein
MLSSTSNGDKIAFSQGKCCACSLLDYIVDSGDYTRSNLACSLDDAAYSSSAHCLRFDPLHYHAYAVGNPSTYYAISVQLNKCPFGRCAGAQASQGYYTRQQRGRG